MSTLLEAFKDFDRTVEEMKNKKIPNSYWEAEDELLKKMEEEKEQADSIVMMTTERFHRCFSL